MVSEAQIEANRENAQYSSGPKSEEGKSNSKINAMKHGLLSKEILVEGEDENDLVELGKKIRVELKPIGN